MPIIKTTMPGPSKSTGYKFGPHGHVYPTRQAAVNQMRAMYANGYTGAHHAAKHGHKK